MQQHSKPSHSMHLDLPGWPPVASAGLMMLSAMEMEEAAGPLGIFAGSGVMHYVSEAI